MVLTAPERHPARGVIVEAVHERTDPLHGINPGDRLLSWRCGPGGANRIASPFDVAELWIERLGCAGGAIVEGERAGRRARWRLGAVASSIDVRPDFTGEALSAFLAGKQFAEHGRISQAVAVWNRIPSDLIGKTWLLTHSAEALSDQHHWSEADGAYKQAIELAAKSRPIVSAEIHYAWAESFLSRSDWTPAERQYRAALDEISKRQPDGLAADRYINGLGTVALRKGDLESAEKLFLRDLSISDRLSPNSSDAPLNNLGSIAWSRGDLVQAQAFLERSLAITAKTSPGTMSFAKSLANFGSLLFKRGQLEEAEEYLRRSLEIVNQIDPGSPGVAIILHNLGSLYVHRGDFDAAQATFREALKIKRVAMPGSLSLATTLSSIAKAEDRLGRLSPAEKDASDALNIRKKLSPGSLVLSDSLEVMGDISRDQGHLPRAEEFYRQALAITTRLASGSVAEAEIVGALGEVKAHEGQLNAAALLYNHAIALLESQSRSLVASDVTRSEFRADHLRLYAEYIDILLAQGRTELAFQVLERSRAQILLETLSAARVEFDRGIPADLRAQVRTLRQTLQSRIDERMRLFTTKHTDDELVKVGNEVNALLSQSAALETRIRSASPSYAQLVRPHVLGASEVAKSLLNSDTILLSYSLGERFSHVFVVTPKGVAVRTLPNRTFVEGLARRFYRQVTEHGIADPNLEATGAELSRALLAPCTGEIDGKRLLIVPDGALQYIPFAALPDPTRLADTAPPALIVRHEIVLLPSASVLAAIREESAKRDKPPMSVAVIADPVLDESDERVSCPAGREQASATPRLRFSRLRHAREEADAILALTGRDRGFEALDFDANRALVMGPQLSRYDVVHFATHGVFDSAHPEMSALALSVIDRVCKRQNAFLGLADVYNMNLPVELVVLSGCETALGRNITGEGVFGLTRGFMYAGATRVVASLWNVNDLATAELMDLFYRGMLREGKRPADALRLAQMTLRREKRWAAPFYWAGFELYGEWR